MPPVPNVFTELRTGDLSVSRVRRVAHSTMNYLDNIRNPFSNGATAATAATTVLSSLGNAAQVAEGVAGAGIIYAGVASGFATTGVVVAVAGPQVAVTAAVVGLVVLARSAYSNRDAAHEALAPFVWNLVDAEPPTNPNPTGSLLEDACRAAMTLLEDGKNQIGLMQTKLVTSQTEFDMFRATLDKNYNLFRHMYNEWDNVGKRAPFPNREATFQRLNQSVKQAATVWLQLYDTGFSAGGAAHNYVRRVVHAGNYIQAGNLVALSMKMAYNAGASSSIGGDFFAGCSAAVSSRNQFTSLAAHWDSCLLECSNFLYF